MDFPYGFDSYGPGAGYRTSGLRTVGGYKSTTVYPNPFFDIAHTYLPASTRELYRWCRYYTLTNPLIATATHKLASYSITEVLYETGHAGWKRRWQDMFEKYHQIRQFVVECNLDKIAYGNCFVTVEFPFKKILTCKFCKDRIPADRAKYRFRNFEFNLICGKCHNTGPAAVEDVYVKVPEQIRFVRWNPECVLVRYNEGTGERFYFYDMPVYLRNDIVLGRPSTVQNLPQGIIEAVKKNKAIAFNNGHMFHARNASISRFDQGLGMPRIAPVLKDTFYLQLLKKAQEAILFGYILPMRSVHPAASSSTSDPYSFLNLASWKEKVRGEIERWRVDPLYIPIFPIPVGYQSMGGDGKQLNLANEIRAWSEHIITGMGIPTEFIFGGLSYSGSSVSLRALENEFLGIREDNLQLLHFLRDRVSWYLGWEPIELKFKPFKMADDLQRAAFDMQLMQNNMLSRRTMLEQRDYDWEREQDRIREELPNLNNLSRRSAEFQTETQGKQSVIMARYQAEAGEIQQEAAMKAQQAAQAQQGGQPAQPAQPGQSGQPEQQGMEGAPPTDAETQGIEQAAQGQQAPPGYQEQQNPMLQQQQQYQYGRQAIGPGGIVNTVPELNEQSVQNAANGSLSTMSAIDAWSEALDSYPADEQIKLLSQLKQSNPAVYDALLYRRTQRGAFGMPTMNPSEAANAFENENYAQR